MKRTIKQILSFFMVIAILLGSMPLSIFAQTESPATDFEYTIVDSQVEITGYIGTATEVVIPAEIEGYPVTSIQHGAFGFCESITKISIPESITSIEVSAFEWCESLVAIEVSENNPSYSSVDGVLFNKDKTELVCCPMTREGEYVIPASVSIIGDSAFEWCELLTSISLPEGLTSIGDYAFYSCRALSNISIPEGVTNIGNNAFLCCFSLTSINIPESVTSIGESAFGWCESLGSITVSEKNQNYTSVDGVLFNKDKTELVCCPVTKEGDYIIPDSVTSIGVSAFACCRSLTSISIPNGVKSIGWYAFDSCSSLTSIILPNSVTSIGDAAFEDCYFIDTIIIPEGVEYLSESMFDGCDSLHSIMVSDKNQKYSSQDGVLFNKDKTKLICYPAAKSGKYTIPESVTSMGAYAFEYCLFLTSVSIPNGVESLDSSVFYGCVSLESIIIPANVTKIGYSSFALCESLKDIYYTGTKTQWDAIEIEDDNDVLSNVTIHFNYATSTVPNEITPSADSNVVVDTNKAIVLGIAAQTKTSDAIAKFESPENIQISGKDGKLLADDAFVGTGCKVQLVKSGEVKDEVTIVIKGEIDGNGKIDSDDAIYLLRNTLFASLYPVVAEDDVDGNGEYNSDDAIHLLRHTLFPSLYPLK